MNRLYYGDNLIVLCDTQAFPDACVDLIYLDPPFDVGADFSMDIEIGGETFHKEPNLLEQIRAFRDTWKLGIHSYLAYLRDRLTAARELLTESGSVFVPIGDENVHLALCLPRCPRMLGEMSHDMATTG